MTAITCGRPGCGNQLRIPARGPRLTYCSDACRKAAARQGAAEAPAATTDTASVRGFAPRPFYRDSGDGDQCPQAADHGRMYFMKPGTRQWCPSSLHKGNPFYAHDGITPAPTLSSAPGFVGPGGFQRGLAPSPRPEPSTRDASTPAAAPLPREEAKQPLFPGGPLTAAGPGAEVRVGG